MLNQYVTFETVSEYLEDLIEYANETGIEYADIGDEITQKILMVAEFDNVMLDEDKVNEKVCNFLKKM